MGGGGGRGEKVGFKLIFFWGGGVKTFGRGREIWDLEGVVDLRFRRVGVVNLGFWKFGGGGSLIKRGTRHIPPPTSEFSSDVLNQSRILIIVIIEPPLKYTLVREIATRSEH